GQGRNRLGLLYMQGLGVLQDYVQAYFWFSLDGEGENGVDARTHLTPAQIRGVERLINQWKAQHRPSPELEAALHILEVNFKLTNALKTDPVDVCLPFARVSCTLSTYEKHHLERG